MNTSVYRNLKHMPEADKLGYLLKVGYTEVQAVDILNYLKTIKPLGKREPSQKFTETEQWEQMKNRMGELANEAPRSIPLEGEPLEIQPPRTEVARPPNRPVAQDRRGAEDPETPPTRYPR